MTNQEIHQGRCLCGQVQYKVQGSPLIVAHCHCEDCQRLTGAGHSTGAMFNARTLELMGEVAEYKLTSENGNEVTRVFCPVCGSPILGRNTGMPGTITLSLGTMEDSSVFEPGVVVFARNRKAWDMMDESIETHAAQPAWSPENGAGAPE